MWGVELNAERKGEGRVRANEKSDRVGSGVELKRRVRSCKE